jgi:AcrR family transcriptional regulator
MHCMVQYRMMHQRVQVSLRQKFEGVRRSRAREAIVEAAERLFLVRGLRLPSVNELAGAAGARRDAWLNPVRHLSRRSP